MIVIQLTSQTQAKLNLMTVTPKMTTGWLQQRKLLVQALSSICASAVVLTPMSHATGVNDSCS